jgi:hypothetical protein
VDQKQIDYETKQVDGNFAVLVGPGGVGKTTAVETAANGLPGVILINDVAPGTSKSEILRRVCENINGTSLGDKEERSIKIVQVYKTISGGQVPAVIISADQRLFGERPAALTASARTLSYTYGLNVFIDTSENALPSDLSFREEIREMKPMEDEMMRELPQFKELFEYLNESKNDRVVLAVVNLMVARPFYTFSIPS